MVTLPDGYTSLEAPGMSAFSVPELRGWVERVLAGGTLYAEAEARAERTLSGRGPVPVVTVEGGPRVVRHYHRGGALAHLLGDRYLRLGEPRPLRELRASVGARRGGIPTPRVVAGAWYRDGPFYRADLVTDYVSDSTDLAGILFGGADPAHRREALQATGSLIAKMAAIGLRHPDLNARNVLLREVEGRLEAVLLDLDRAQVPVVAASTPSKPMLERLLRSLRKIGGRSPGGPTDAELEVLRDATSRGDGRA